MKGSFIVIGDIMIDETWLCECDRLSPEAPIPVASLIEKEERLGGAGNAAANLRALDGNDKTPIILYGHLPRQYKEFTDKLDIQLPILPNTNNASANIKLRITDTRTGYQIVRVDNEQLLDKATLSPNENTETAIVQSITDASKKGPVTVIISDYGKGYITPRLMRRVMSCYDEMTYIIVDTRREDISMFQGVDWITPNEHEYARMCKELGLLPNFHPENLHTFLEVAEIHGIILTRGHRGMICQADNWRAVLPATNAKAIDVTGAGDTVTATLAYMLMKYEKMHYNTMVRAANVAAGMVCEIQGTATSPCSAEELLYKVTQEDKF
ncbi:MAG: hypothetical protein DRN26_00100 [Thermoplasmata archaeon]|nr:MAG: hypothetical protein DRN26_00100 [Thermoplasmata archaeon]